MLAKLAHLAVGLFAISLVSLGLGATAVPDLAAHMYGVDADSQAARAFVRATGVRDLAVGLVLAVLWRWPIPRALLGSCTIALSVIALGDFLTVVTAAGSAPGEAYALHAGGFVTFLAVGIVLLRSRDAQSES